MLRHAQTTCSYSDKAQAGDPEGPLDQGCERDRCGGRRSRVASASSAHARGSTTVTSGADPGLMDILARRGVAFKVLRDALNPLWAMLK